MRFILLLLSCTTLFAQRTPLKVNGTVINNPDLTNSASVTWNVAGSKVSGSSSGGAGTNLASLTITNSLTVLNATASKPARIGADQTVTNGVITLSGSDVTGVLPSANIDSDQATDSEVTAAISTLSSVYIGKSTNGVVQPFDPAKTYIVILGDSNSTGPSYGEAVTNMAWWSGLRFFTNLAIAGIGYTNQTNEFYTHALPALPSTAGSGGTNVIVSLYTVGNDFIASTTAPLSNYPTFFSDLRSRGYIVVQPTCFGRTNFTDVTYSNVFRLNNWLIRSSNVVDRVPDFARVTPDHSDTNFFNTDGIHWTALAKTELAKEWDRTVRLASSPSPFYGERLGILWHQRKSDGQMVDTVDDNGVHYQVKSGGANTATYGTGVGGVFGGRSSADKALIAHGGSGAASSQVVFGAGSYAAATEFQVFVDGHFTASGTCSIGGGGTFTISSGGTGNDMYRMLNVGGGKTYYMGSRSDGALSIKDNTLGADALLYSQTPHALVNSTATTVCTLSGLSGGNFSAGTISYKLFATDGTDHQVGAGILVFSLVNKAGTLSKTLTDTGSAMAASSGTFIWTWDATISGNNVSIKITPITSLTPSTYNFRCLIEQQGTAGTSISL